jgi:hypothetical protein
MQECLDYYADKGMGFLLSAAGGPPNWSVEEPIRQVAAARLLQELVPETLDPLQTNPADLNDMDNMAVKNLVAKVLFHMKYMHNPENTF